MKFIVGLMLFLSSCWSCGHLLPVEQKTDPVKQSYASVGRLSVKSKDGKKAIFASGFAVSDDYVATAGHFCVGWLEGNAKNEFPDKIDVMFVYNKELIELKQVLEVVLIEEKRDVCILKNNPGLVPVKFADYSKVSVGDKVYTIGAPLSLFAQYSEGRVNIPKMDVGDGKKLLFMSLPISPGNSGSPVFDEQGKVIGMVIASIVPNVFMIASSPFALAQRGDILIKFVRMTEDE